MSPRHYRLGFAVLAGVLVALSSLGVLVIRTGGGADVRQQLSYAAAPAPTQVAAPASAGEMSRSATRSPVRHPGVDPGWARRTGVAAGIPVPAMVAYGDAELRVDTEQPGCHLSWNTLAGIGWVESQQGTVGGRTLQVDGRSSTPVIGPALDGRRFAAIRSTTASARWHGDATWEHAVGPMQFIASTWARWGADGDGDGRRDPLDLDDAALTTARYLCADGHDLSSATGWNVAVHSYNHDDAYVANVRNAANTYAQRSAAIR